LSLVAPTLIEEQPPADWVGLQDQVSLILNECGLESKTTVTVALARGRAEIDVYAEDKQQTPSTLVFCECKNWKSAIPQNVVHGFRTVVSDGGANIGYLICTSSFQSGAKEAATNSNVRPVTWEEFQAVYADRWFERHFFPTFHKESDRLAGYAEPMAPIAGLIPEDLREQFWARFDHDYEGVGIMGLHTNTMKFDSDRRGLSLRKIFFYWVEKERASIPEHLFGLQSLRGWLDGLLHRAREGYDYVDTFFKTHHIKRGGSA
jgi:hypothetical protein